MFVIARANSVEDVVRASRAASFAPVVASYTEGPAAVAPPLERSDPGTRSASAASAKCAECDDGGASWRPRGGFMELEASPPFALPCASFERLFEYQRTGVAWMAQLQRTGRGGMLADDMGLGKTVQICALLSGLRRCGARHALVVVPLTLMDQWTKELGAWCVEWPVHTYQGTPAQRAMALRNASREEGGVVLVSYSIFTNSVTQLAHMRCMRRDFAIQSASKRKLRLGPRDDEEAEPKDQEGDVRPWDLVVCDEAHKLKNVATQLGRSVRSLQAISRILLTGTPVQNSLQDLWSLMDFAQPGLLGNRSTFVQRFAEPIANGSVRNATPYAIGLKNFLSEQLWEIVKPHLLRRTKVSVGLLAATEAPQEARPEDATKLGCEGLTKDVDSTQPSTLIPPKMEVIVWLAPTDAQASLYKRVLADSEIVRQAANRAKLGVEVFQAIGLLKRLCNHPLLTQYKPKPIPPRIAVDADDQHTETLADVSIDDDEDEGTCPVPTMAGIASLIAQSSKLRCLQVLLKELANRGHHILVFSQSPRMLDLIEVCVLRQQKIPYLRVDGKTDVASRAERVNDFQSGVRGHVCMLMTTGVGGFGLNITRADRVIIVDPAWNPATDQQAIDRVHRLGQRREVVVYRLIMSGLIEDKMFRLQVFKMGLTRTALECQNQQRHYFTNKEIRGLFDWADPSECETRTLLDDKSRSEQDDVLAKLTEDGADEWRGPGLVLGLSDTSGLLGALRGQADCGGSLENPVMAAAREKMYAAEAKVEETTKARRATDEQVCVTEKAYVCASTSAVEAANRRKQFDIVVRERTAELARLERLELLVAQVHSSSEAAFQKAKERCTLAEEDSARANQAAGECLKLVTEARKALSAVERRICETLEELKQFLNEVDPEAEIKRGTLRVVAPSVGLRVTRRTFAATSHAITTMQARQCDWQAAEEELLTASMSLASSSNIRSLPLTSGVHTRAPAEVVAGSKPLPDDLYLATQKHSFAVKHADAAMQELTNRTDDLQKAGSALVESLRGASGVDVSLVEVSSARKGAAASLQSLHTGMSEMRLAQQAWYSAVTHHGEQRQRAARAADAHAEAQTQCLIAEGELKKIADTLSARRTQCSDCAAELRAAQAAKIAADEDESGSRRKRDRLTSTLGAEYLAALRSRAAEEEAALGRTAMRAEWSKAEHLLMEMELTSASAVEALRTEAYDPCTSHMRQAGLSSNVSARKRLRVSSALAERTD